MYHKQLLGILLIGLHLTTFSCKESIPASAPETVEQVAYVDAVVDGDTLRLARGTLVRLIGVDAPEKDGPHTTREPGGQKATRFVSHFLDGEVKIYLAFDHNKYDEYGRLLAYVYRGSDFRLLNEAIIRAGWAKAYRKYSYRKKQAFLDTEKKARTKRVGIWSDTK